MEYLEKISTIYQSGKATEHSYRPALKEYLETLLKDITATNEPKRQKCGAPDYIITRHSRGSDIDIGYIEAKDIGIDLDKTEKDEQLSRYKESLDNLILTDYIDFRFFKEGSKVAEVKIARAEKGKLVFIPENIATLESLLKDFSAFQGQTISSAKTLAVMIARKAKLMQEVFSKALNSQEHNSLQEQLTAFRRILIHDMTSENFADVYAQTITYGLFTARLHSNNNQIFSRSEALHLIPLSNPFLRRLFQYVALELDEGVKWIVDAVCEVLRATDMHEVMQDFGKQSGRNDPIVHFYETFLAEYNPNLRKSRGVWYTPEPVVNFIIRAVDDCLKTYFNLPMGLADSSKIKIKIEAPQTSDKRTKSGKALLEKEVHRVQLLDVATGTGTFIAEVIKQIYNGYFLNQQGMWSGYVEEHLLPRLHGFEILMASYAMCHTKIELLLEETGYKPKNPLKQPRLGVYLTNSLEEAHPDAETLFASWLAAEANEASLIKRETPVMVALGNPPYSVSSQNKGEWINNLITDYKTNLNEKNINSLSDDYIKFIRHSEHYIEKNGSGIVAMITNNSFLDGIIHRQMRKHLLETFDTIYIYDLHGSSKKKETAPDGSQDQNVFDIQQGVSIGIFIKHKIGKKELAEVYHYDSYGKRAAKYNELWQKSLKETDFKKLDYSEPYYFFVPKDFGAIKKYNKGFGLEQLFIKQSMGTASGKDDYFVGSKQELINRFSGSDLIKKYLFRPFDEKYILYDKTLLQRARHDLFRHLVAKDNLAMAFTRQTDNPEKINSIITRDIVCRHAVSSQTYAAPLYLDIENTLDDKNREPNLEHKIVKQISKKLGLPFVSDHEDKKADGKTAFSPLDLLDYIYAVLHSPTYRETYKEFLKIDFPRIPYPENSEIFWQSIALGKEIRLLHLLESPVLNKFITSYPVTGDDIIDKIFYDNGKVYINKSQYFENIPEIAWNFYIGGYQPAQKWLKDRKGRTLNFDEIIHYQKIIVALSETDRIMKEIDRIL